MEMLTKFFYTFTTAILVLALFGAGFATGYIMALDIFSLECFKTGMNS
tara:strand:- start:71 stop:214 length:144 start_codon:yes stop_codon:yes gene_type:complete